MFFWQQSQVKNTLLCKDPKCSEILTLQRPPAPESTSPSLSRRNNPVIMQRPPRTDRPGPMQRTPRCDHPTPIQRPPRTDRPGPMQRMSMSGSTALVPRPPRSVSPTLMPRPPRSNPPAPMQMSPRSDSPALMPRPHRSEPSVPIQRPPRSNPPAPMQHPPQTDPSLMQSLPRTDSHVPMQRPPRIKPPAPMHRHPGSEALSSMHRGPRTEPSSTIQRPPRTEPPHPMKKVSRSDPSACMKRPPVSDAPTPMQRPPRTDPPAPIQIQLRDDQLASVQKNSTMVSNNGVEIHETCTTELRCTSPNISVQVTKNDSAKSLGLVGGAWNDPEVHLEKVNSQHGPETNSPKPLSGDGNLPVQGSPGAWRSLQPKETPESDGTDGDGELFIPLEDQGRPDEDKRKKKRKRKREEEDETLPCDLDSTLDQKLEDGAKQHNLTAVNVRNILHEVITNEHVVAMMKAAITETQDMPLFEPKMTRSKLKEVVQKGVVIPTWTLSPIKKASEVKVPQFVDIPLAEEDSSDEEYQPEEEEDDETAEESLLESDVESTASSPRGPKRQKVQRPPETVENEEKIVKYQQVHRTVPVRHVSAEVVPMGPPAPPKLKHSQDSTFMEKLHAVDEELASNLVSMESYQPLGASLVACRTRSKRTLKDVPIGQLEAELQAPDITPDMYDPNTADDEDWKLWLRSLMQDDVGNEDEADDEDDPEYNILEDLEEPDTEDLRNDRAVRITKKEVNELMEELFETFQDEMGFSHLENEIPEDEDSNTEAPSNFNTPQALRFEEPLVNLLNEQHRTVKAQLEFLRMKKTITRTVTAELEEAKLPPPAPPPLPCPPKDAPVLFLDTVQKRRLQQQMQQHVQLLTQMHLLTCKTPRLSQEADNARMFLVELSSFAESSSLAHHPCNPDFQSMFQPCNLREALQLLPIIQSQIPESSEPPKPQRKNVNEVLILPQHIAWIMATRTVFMYPELLPLCALKPKGPRDRVYFTKGEDNLLALGLKHFEGTEFSKTLISKYLVTSKTAQQLTVRIKNLTMKKTPDNIIKFYKKMKFLPIMCKCCDDVIDLRPPVEREKHRLPFWLKASLPNIEAEMEKLEKEAQNSDTRTEGSLFPLLIPEGVTLNLKPLPSRFYRKTRRQRRPTILKPLLIRPSNNISSIVLSKTAVKPSVPEPVPIRLYKRVSIQSVVPVQDIPTVHPVHIATPRKFSELSVPIPSGGRGIQIMSVSQSAPLTQPKMMLPALSTQKFKKPPICRVPRRKMVPRTTGFKAAPLINSAPILFAVPNGALNLVSLGTTCGMMQPVNSGNGIPVTTLLLNPTSFPLNQTFVSPPLSQAVVTSPLPVSEDNVAPPGPCSLMSEASIAGAGTDEKTYFKEEPIALEEEEKYTSITIKVEKEEEVQDAGGENGSQEQEGGNMTGENGGPENEVENAAEDSGGHYAPAEEGSCLAADNVRGLSDGGDDRSTLNPVNILHSPVEEKPEIKSECDPNSPQTEQVELNEDIEKQEIEESALPQTQPLKEEPLGCDDPGDMEEPLSDVKCSHHPTEQEDKMANTMQTQEVTEPGDSPKNTSSSTDCDVDMNSPVGTHHDSSSPPGPQEGTNDKDGQEEEEEEDFDELTQDDDEEEMSSASEESVLSVPELQETMEKLTWLASERRLSQEGDSEENSEPEEEEEEEEEGEGVECLSRKQKTADEVAEGSVEQAPSQLHIPSPAPAPATTTPTGERRRGSAKVASSHRVRSRRGRGRASKDASKLLLLYDENILVKDPLREQKDMAFAQAYLNRVREVLHLVPGKYEQFLQLIYQFEMCREQRTAVDLYRSIRELLKDWPQLLKDFAAFLLPEQALECGLFEEQQAFDKSRKFLRQLEICFLENPTHHQKIIKLLQSCAECPQQEITKLKAQMWQLLKGHDHLQDEFSLFFDQLRPPVSRMGDFEVLNWTEDKMYKLDGFEEVTLPDVEEEEEPNKIPPPPRSKRRKEVTQGQEKEADWVDGGKDCPCACHEVSEHRMKRCKRRLCSQCSSKACESRTHRHRETPDRGGAGTPSAPRHGHLIREGGSGEGKGTVSEERLTTGGRALMGNRETSIQDSNVPSQRSRSGVTLTESSDGSRQRTLRPGSRGGRKPPALKAPPGALNIAAIEVQDVPSKPSETSPVHSLSPSKHSQIPSPTSPHLGVSTSNTKECTPESEPADQSHKRDPSISQADETSDKEEQLLTVCAKNITVSSSGEKVILWTRDADRVILTMCQEQGAREETFTAVSEQLGNKSSVEVSQRFQELVQLFQTACVTSSDEEDDAGSTTEQLSDQDLPLSEEELED